MKRDEWDVVSEQDGVEIIEPTKIPEIGPIVIGDRRRIIYEHLVKFLGPHHLLPIGFPVLKFEREPVSVTPEILEQVNYELHEHMPPPGYNRRRDRPIHRAKGRKIKSKCGFNHI